MHYVYVLRSRLDSTFYIGCTSDIAKRLKEHNHGKTRSTKPHRPYKLVYSEQFENKTLALAREYELKHNSKKKALLLTKIIESLTALSSNG